MSEEHLCLSCRYFTRVVGYTSRQGAVFYARCLLIDFERNIDWIVVECTQYVNRESRLDTSKDCRYGRYDGSEGGASI